MDARDQRAAARRFAEYWQQAEGYEMGETASFWLGFARDVLGIADATRALDFERRVAGKRIDVFYEDRRILVEQKSRGVDLDTPEARGSEWVTPYQQALGYCARLPFSIRPRWVITCNFDEFRIYDQEHPEDPYVSVRLADLDSAFTAFSFFTDDATSELVAEQRLSMEAGRIVGRLYDLLGTQYLNLQTDEREQRSLNILITRIVFLLYAEDAGLLHERQGFCNYLKRFGAAQMRSALAELFRVLDTPEDARDPYLAPELAAFPYVNGGLFADEDVVIPQFTEDIRHDLLLEASIKFDWSDISPTIFGAVFESTLNPETRRAGGMHYTSVANIHKVIDPLFLDALRAELVEIEAMKVERQRMAALRAFRVKLSRLRFLDPAAGSCNFLTESYLSLRRLELRALEGMHGDQMAFGGFGGFGASAGATSAGGYGFACEGAASSCGFAESGAGSATAPGADSAGAAVGRQGAESPILVNISQFYGIEINDFAVAVGKTALWIAEQQMLERTQELLPFQTFEFLPLKANPNIVCGNALRMDWNEVLPAAECTYVLGNPPFLGARNQSPGQKAELAEVFRGAKNCGNVDYVAGWYVKAAEYTDGLPVRCAFVSTNSITQGEQVANVWKPLWDAGVRIDFAHDTFRWKSEAADMAHVFVVIVGFSRLGGPKRLFHHAGPDAEAEERAAGNINAYLSDAPDAFVWNRSKALCRVPAIGIGNKPIDGGNYIFKDGERDEFLKAEPGAARFMHRFLGSQEFINGNPRSILYLANATPAELDELPLCRERIEAVRAFRLASKSAPTRKLAERPANYHVENMPAGDSILIPEVSSERREYIPMGFIGPDTFCSNLVRLVPDATLYHFGILQSRMHNAWMRTVAGRLKSDYRYSGGVVYNTFPWPGVTRETLDVPTEECVPPETRVAVEVAAQAVLDARAAHPARTLADLYDPDKMPPDLRSAHDALDAAVESAYHVTFQGDEQKIVSHLFTLYAELAE